MRARFPNMGRSVTVGRSGTSLVKAAFAWSLGFGIGPPAIGLIAADANRVSTIQAAPGVGEQ